MSDTLRPRGWEPGIASRGPRTVIVRLVGLGAFGRMRQADNTIWILFADFLLIREVFLRISIYCGKDDVLPS